MSTELPTIEELQETGAKKAEIVSLISVAQDLIGDLKDSPSSLMRERKDDLLEFYDKARTTVMDLSDDPAVTKTVTNIVNVYKDVTDGDGQIGWKPLIIAAGVIVAVVLFILLG